MPSTWQIRKWGEQPSMPLENIKFLAFLPVEFRKTARSEYYASVGLILGLQTPLSVVAFLGVPPWAKRNPQPDCRAQFGEHGTFQSPGRPQEAAKRAWSLMGVMFVLLFFWLGTIII